MAGAGGGRLYRNPAIGGGRRGARESNPARSVLETYPRTQRAPQIPRSEDSRGSPTGGTRTLILLVPNQAAYLLAYGRLKSLLFHVREPGVLLGAAELLLGDRQVAATGPAGLALRLLRVVVVAEGSQIVEVVVVVVADVIHFEARSLQASGGGAVEAVGPGAAMAVAG